MNDLPWDAAVDKLVLTWLDVVCVDASSSLIYTLRPIMLIDSGVIRYACLLLHFVDHLLSRFPQGKSMRELSLLNLCLLNGILSLLVPRLSLQMLQQTISLTWRECMELLLDEVNLAAFYDYRARSATSARR